MMANDAINIKPTVMIEDSELSDISIDPLDRPTKTNMLHKTNNDPFEKVMKKPQDIHRRVPLVSSILTQIFESTTDNHESIEITPGSPTDFNKFNQRYDGRQNTKTPTMKNTVPRKPVITINDRRISVPKETSTIESSGKRLPNIRTEKSPK